MVDIPVKCSFEESVKDLAIKTGSYVLTRLLFKIISFLVKAIGSKEGPLGLQVAKELLELVNTSKVHGVYFGNFLTLLHEE